jgi:L-asparaginase
MTKSKILLIYTGGTIGMVKEENHPHLRPFNFENILEKVKEIKLLNCHIDTVSIENPIDSSNICINNWIELVEIIKTNYNSFDGFVILHGTDTMSYTASALSFLIQNLSKPIILTGSQLPLGDLRTDAKEHLITSIQLASSVHDFDNALLSNNQENVIKEVCLYFNNKLYRGNRTTKVNSDQFKAYASFNYPEIAQSGVDLKVNYNNIFKPVNNNTTFYDSLDDRVSLLRIFPGISEKIVKHILSDDYSKVVIIETFGSGNVLNSEWFLKEIKSCIEGGKYVINVSQCPKGRVKMGQYESSVKLIELGLISGKDITIESAICKSMFLLTKETDFKTFKKLFELSICGEIS